MNNLEVVKLSTLAFIYILTFTLESYSPYFKQRKHHFQHSTRNLAIALINASISTLFVIFIIKHAFSWTTSNQLGILNQLELSNTLSFIIAFILIDLWQYVWHRANHVIPLLWKFHQVHHSDKEMDASTGLRFHPIEIIYSNAIRIAIIPILGLQIEHLILYELILLPVILFHHSNITLSDTIDKTLRSMIVTPHMHRLHHSDIRIETDSNYSSVFSVWDRLFASFSMRSIEKDFNLGLGNKFKEHEWNKLTGIISIPFKK